MNKPTLLYASPFWPMKSGISEYSEVLIEGLNEFFDLTLLVDGYRPTTPKVYRNYKIRSYSTKDDYSDYDYIIYNIGNNPEFHSYMYHMILEYPGYIILHEFVLYYLTVGYYAERNELYSKLYEIEGIRGINIVKHSVKEKGHARLLEHKDISTLLPLNKEIIDCAKGIFVHSLYTKKKLETVTKTDITEINLVNGAVAHKEENNYLKERFGLDEHAYIITSIGLIGPAKQNRLICDAVDLYNQQHKDKVYYIMCGEGDYVNDKLNQYIIKTGFLSNDDYFKAIQASDLTINLRYPYNGEASATVIHCMALEKPVIVTDIGWFSELPDDCVVKLDIDITVNDLAKKIECYKMEKLEEMIEKAKVYIEEKCNPESIADSIAKVVLKQS